MRRRWAALAVVVAACAVTSCADGFKSCRSTDSPGYTYLKVTRCIYAGGPSHDLVLVETAGGWYYRASLLFVKGEADDVFLVRIPHKRSGTARCGSEAVCLGSLHDFVRLTPYGGVVVGNSFPGTVKLNLSLCRTGPECADPDLKVTVKCRPKEDREAVRRWVNGHSAGLGAMRERVLDGTGLSE